MPADPTVSAVVTLRPGARYRPPGSKEAPPEAAAEAVGAAPDTHDPALAGVAIEDAAFKQQEDKPLPPDMRTMSTVKGHFTSAGFEVHAPFHTSFSIGGPRSLFERVFGDEVVIDDKSLVSSVRTGKGTLELTIDALPDEIRDLVESVAFMPPPELPGLG